VLLLLGLAFQAEQLFRQFDVFGLWSLVAFGVVAILASSLLDRYGEPLGSHVAALRQAVAAWTW
jgi:hypothetical protein